MSSWQADQQKGNRSPLADAGNRANEVLAPQSPARTKGLSQAALDEIAADPTDWANWRSYPGAPAPVFPPIFAAEMRHNVAMTIHGFDHHQVKVPYDTPVDMNCDQVRLRITRLLDNGLPVRLFCDTIGVTTASLNRFRKQNGPENGSRCDAYHAAWEYFKRMEIAGAKMPTKKAAVSRVAGGSAVSATGGSGQSYPDVSSIQLDGEENDSVEVYDTCDEIRKKIAAYITKAGVTQAQFCRDLHAQMHGADKPKSIQSAQLDKFRSNKGATAGVASSVFYAAYVFFEKLRIAEGKPKSKHRLNMEQQWPGGMDLNTRRNRAWCVAGTRPYVNQYGIMTVR